MYKASMGYLIFALLLKLPQEYNCLPPKSSTLALYTLVTSTKFFCISIWIGKVTSICKVVCRIYRSLTIINNLFEWYRTSDLILTSLTPLFYYNPHGHPTIPKNILSVYFRTQCLRSVAVVKTSPHCSVSISALHYCGMRITSYVPKTTEFSVLKI